MPVTSLPWDAAPDIAGDYLRGLQTGASIAQERQRLAQQEHVAEMDASARAQQLQREALREQQRIAISQARMQAETGLRKQALDQAASMNAFKVQQAAAKMRDQYGFARDLASGMSVEQALYRHPSLSTPQAAIQAHRDAEDLAGQRLKFNQEKLAKEEELRTREYDLRERGIKDRETKVPNVTNVPAVPTPSMDTYKGPRISLPANSPMLNTLLPGTNSALLGTNWPGGGVPVPPANAGASVPVSTSPAAPVTKNSPYAEGSTLFNKRDGKYYVVVNGQPVPKESEQTPSEAESPDTTSD